MKDRHLEGWEKFADDPELLSGTLSMTKRTILLSRGCIEVESALVIAGIQHQCIGQRDWEVWKFGSKEPISPKGSCTNTKPGKTEGSCVQEVPPDARGCALLLIYKHRSPIEQWMAKFMTWDVIHWQNYANFTCRTSTSFHKSLQDGKYAWKFCEPSLASTSLYGKVTACENSTSFVIHQLRLWDL